MKLTKYFALALLLFVGCNPKQTQELELIGHRGATGLLPENSIPGFKEALKHDVNSIEFDVVISGDENIVISHEPWMRHDICIDSDGNKIKEKNQKKHLLYKMEYEEIARYDCGSMQRPGFPNQETQSLSKPLMKEAIAEIESFRIENDYPPIRYNVEIKSKPKWDNELQPAPEKVIQLVYNELKKMDMLERVRIFAFDSRILNELQEIDSSVPQVYLIPKSKPDISENLSKLTTKPDIYAPNYNLIDSSLVDEIHRRGMQVVPWTVNDYEDMVRLVELGVDGIISDYPNYYKKLRSSL